MVGTASGAEKLEIHDEDRFPRTAEEIQCDLAGASGAVRSRAELSIRQSGCAGLSHSTIMQTAQCIHRAVFDTVYQANLLQPQHSWLLLSEFRRRFFPTQSGIPSFLTWRTGIARTSRSLTFA